MKEYSSERALKFTESVIRDMTRVCLKHQGVNLAQGFPDFPAPAEIKEAAIRAITSDFNQYAITWGTPSLRQAIADKFAWYNGVSYRPGKGDHGLLRVDRGHDCFSHGDRQSRRRGDRLRAFL